MKEHKFKTESYLVKIPAGSKVGFWEIQIARNIDPHESSQYLGKAHEAVSNRTIGWTDLTERGIASENRALNAMIEMCKEAVLTTV